MILSFSRNWLNSGYQMKSFYTVSTKFVCTHSLEWNRMFNKDSIITWSRTLGSKISSILSSLKNKLVVLSVLSPSTTISIVTTVFKSIMIQRMVMTVMELNGSYVTIVKNGKRLSFFLILIFRVHVECEQKFGEQLKKNHQNGDEYFCPRCWDNRKVQKLK